MEAAAPEKGGDFSQTKIWQGKAWVREGDEERLESLC